MKKINNNAKSAATEDKRGNEIIRIQKKRNNFVMLDKGFIEDERLSWKAKGILTYLLSKHDNWKVIVKDIINHSKDGERAVYSGLRELEKYGYYQKKPVRKNGLIAYWESVIFECPNEQPEKHEEPPKNPPTEKDDEKTPISPLLGCFVDVDNEDVHSVDVQNDERNNININKNKPYQYNISIYQSENEIPTPVNPPTQNKEAAPPPIDTIDITEPVIKIYTEQEVADKISLDDLKTTYPDKHEDIDMLYDCVCEVLAVDNPASPTFRISKQNIPFLTVKNAFKQLEKKHIEYVIHSLNNNDNKHKINKNTKSYLMTSLFHSPRTVSYFANRSFQKQKNDNDNYSYGGLSSDEWFEKLVRKSMKF